MRLLKIVLALSCSIAAALMFQNCSKSVRSFTDPKVTEQLSSLGYRYENATPVYYDIQVGIAESTSQSTAYSVMIYAAPSDGKLEILDFQLEVLGRDAVPLCTEPNGEIPSGESFKAVTCVVAKPQSIATVSLKIKKRSDSDWISYTKTY